MSKCRFCHKPLTRSFVDLGLQPLANSYVSMEKAGQPEPRYPLHARVCENCLLVQVDHDVPAEAIFSDYAYFSSYATSWVEHARRYAESMTQRFGLDAQSLVVEVASNDGYLLQHFKAAGIGVLGVEPAANVAAAALEKGIPSEVAFFNRETAERLHAAGKAADLMTANNVMAHVPELNQFISGFAVLLKPQGVLTVEFPHLLNLIEQVQFDTIYHEHYSYLSLLAAEKIFAAHGLRVFDVEELSTHGGSLRLYVCHRGADHVDTVGLAKLRKKEAAAGLDTLAAYDDFAPRVATVRDELRGFLVAAKTDGRKVCAYGAAAKGNTLLNYCGIMAQDIVAAYDKNPHKQRHLLPGSQIPIRAPEAIVEDRPDYLLILPWNLKNEIAAEQSKIRDWNGHFVIAIPQMQIF
ncbi:class I SAM-dependent methyltransferase [Ferrovibrio terrae]|uniref:Class I SAM-dependent methyltransferase n=1 Tax=Ferrovibrio terrae TaxID=2594003 RepID=A0A516GXR6_9PROT|nr:class I SAM-dependent methyltransferase [Ferrovibrio terrae]QDO96285.1 class I SAM-dependent methyltransferase [Ferrovibrio terrae]